MIFKRAEFQIIIVSTLVAVLGIPACSVPTNTNVTTASSMNAGAHLGEDEYGAIVWGQGTDIKAEVHIADILYSGGNFWVQGIPANLAKWMNDRSKVAVNVMAEDRTVKSVYLSWPPANLSVDEIERMSKDVDAESLFKQPMLLMSSSQTNKNVKFTEAEIKNLRSYLIEKGGFLFIDDNTGDTGTFSQFIRHTLRLALPEYMIERIPNDHEIYRYFYHMGGPPVGSPGVRSRRNYLEGISINGRLAVLISDRGYWDMLVGRGLYSPGVLRFATNMVIYAITHGGISDYSRYIPAEQLSMRKSGVSELGMENR